MANLHTFAFSLAAIHFVVCSMVGAAISGLEILCGMPSGGYQPIAFVFGVLDKLVLLLEAPVAFILWLLYHPTARFQPPSFFVLDFVDSSPLLVIVSLCLLWSIAFGYLISYGRQLFGK